MIKSPKAFIFFGKSGSGKGTQANMLIDFLKEDNPEYKVLYTETGALLREYAGIENNYSASIIKNVLDEGGLLQEFVPITLWGNYLLKNVTGKEHLVFDGVSRREPEAPVLASAMKFYGIKNPNVIFINVGDAWATQRLLERARFDDDKSAINERLAWFEKDVMPAVSYFKKSPDFTFHDINGEQSIDEVHNTILESLFDRLE